MFRSSLGITTAIGTIGYLNNIVQEKYGSSQELPHGTEIEHNGKKYKLIGYFGSDKKIEKTDGRELFYGRLPEAQGYAERRAGNHHIPVVGKVIALDFPTPADHSPSWFEEGPTPLSPAGQRRLDVKVVDWTPVTEENKAGVIAAYKRAIKEVIKPKN